MSNSLNEQELIESLKRLEATQLKILKQIDDFQLGKIPQNSNGVYKIGQARTVFFLNELIPQIYLTLVSVLQGVALAVLVDKFSLIFLNTALPSYGYAIASFLIIVAFWYSYLGAILDGRWPFRFVDTLLFFGVAIFKSLAVEYIATPWIWCLFIGLMCIIVVVIYGRQNWLIREATRLDLFEEL